MIGEVCLKAEEYELRPRGYSQRIGYMPLFPVLCRKGDYIIDADIEHAEYPRGEAGSSVQEVC